MEAKPQAQKSNSNTWEEIESISWAHPVQSYRRLTHEYTDRPIPLVSYGAFLLGYLALAGTLNQLASTQQRRSFREKQSELDPKDYALLIPATHKLSRLITKDWVTAPLRAPFTELKESQPAGEVKENSRGEGLRRATGDLLTCAYCIAPWVATPLVFGLIHCPRTTRRFLSIFAVVAGSDLMHFIFEGLRNRK